MLIIHRGDFLSNPQPQILRTDEDEINAQLFGSRMFFADINSDGM